MGKRERKSKFALDPSYVHRWDKLAVYNAERDRGIVHTPEWDERMAKAQAAFDREVAEEAQYAASDHTRDRRAEIGLQTPVRPIGAE